MKCTLELSPEDFAKLVREVLPDLERELGNEWIVAHDDDAPEYGDVRHVSLVVRSDEHVECTCGRLPVVEHYVISAKPSKAA